MRLDPDIAIEHLCGEQFVRILKLFDDFPEHQSTRSTVVRITHSSRCVKLWHSEHGSLLGNKGRSLKINADSATAKQLSQACDNARVFSLSLQGLRRALKKWQQIEPCDQDYLENLFAVFAKLQAEKTTEIYPGAAWLGWLPFIAKLATGWYWPENQILMFAVFRDNTIWTSVILRRGEAGVDLWTSLDAFRNDLPDQVRLAQISELKQLVERCYGPIHACVGMSWHAFWNLRKQPERKMWGALVQAGEIVADPWPFLWKSTIWAGLGRRHIKTFATEQEIVSMFKSDKTNINNID